MHKDYIYFNIPKKEDILMAQERISKYVHRTPLLKSDAINRMLGCELYFKCENLQKVGAFKSRGAVNAVFSLPENQVRNGVCTHSSGNHAQALARAALLRNVPAFIVMPENAPKVKIEAVKEYGGIISFCEPTLQARETTLAKVAQQTKAIEIHPYDNLKVIEGQATAAAEVYEELQDVEIIMAPVGGGGLLSGTAISTAYFSPLTKVIASEPLGANDAYKSFYSKSFTPSISPKTIADGLLTSLGKYTFPIILKYVHKIQTVEEVMIISAMKTLMERMKIVVEPSSAVPLAAIITNPDFYKGKKIAVILSGGNIDLTTLKSIF